MATQKERFLIYLQTCVKSTRTSESNPLFLGGNAPKDYARFLESDRLFDYNPTKWEHIGSMYDINDYRKALEVFNELIIDNDFLQRDKSDNQGWRRGAISHYVCFLRAQDFFTQNDDKKNTHSIGDLPASLQLVYYGAPGTGKSFVVEEICKKHPHYRTTFHPDSDYSTFVGCYKPKTRRVEPIYSKLQLIDKLSVIKSSGVSYPCHKFAAKYWESLKDLSTADIKDILTACGFTKSMNVEITKGIAVGEELGKGFGNTTITYEFVPQAFTNAYIEAWKDLSKPVFLVIEEINRGNCAQIFGDLFQLLDRKEDGFSSYQIHPDADLKDYIAGRGLSIEGVKDNDGNDISDKLMSGELMTLPKNLHIWATMNTCDQSLFPIDSAFKRRWDWEYVPIQYNNKDWKIVLGNMMYSWVEFQEKMNDLIFAATDSEDKQMGDFFVKADKDNIISEDVLFNKIVFYLWNDVCKDGEGEIFRVKRDGEKDAQDITFSKFVKGGRTRNLQDWMAYLEVKGENEDDPTL